MAVYKRGETWWFKFTFRGEQIRESTKQGNKRIAEQIEAARKTQLAKGEVGIHDRKVSPTLAEFAEQVFIPFVEKQKAEKLNTISFYKQCIARIKTFPRLWNARLDAIRAEDITAYIGVRQALSMSTSTINRDLAALRRMFKLAMEWESVSKLLPTVRLLSGENRRERVITPEEEAAYLEAAAPLLKDFAVLEFDCGLRPEEAHRLKWSQIRNGNIEIHTGKTRDARRSIPASPRVVTMLERRKASLLPSEWVFSAPTKAGHANTSTLKKQHGAALRASGVDPFVIYSLRHTCLTRWAESGMDTFTLKKLAGHANIGTTMRYVHMTDARSREALSKVWKVQSGHKIGHNVKPQASSDSALVL
jgi:integrase